MEKMAKMPSEQKYQNNDLGDPEDALIFRPELPPRAAATTVQRSPPHVSNQNVFAVLVKNRRQITSLSAGLIVLLGSGVHTVWAFWELFFPTPWLETEVIVLVGSWYIATIIGCAIAATLIPKWSKKNLYILSAILLLLSSLLFISRLYPEMRTKTVLFSGRFLAGLANGLAYLTVIRQAAENAVNQIRGVILRGIGYVLAFSLFIAGITTKGTDDIGNDIQAEWIMGFLNLFYSILALILAPLLTIESVPYLMQKTNDDFSVSEREAIAIKTMIKLRNERGETPKIRHDFNEIKHHLYEDELDSRNPFNRQNLRPLFIIIGVRVLSVCAKNLPFTLLIMINFNHMIHSSTFSLYQLFLLLSCRFIFGMFAMFFIDKFERKKYLYIFSIMCGISLLIICIINREETMNVDKTYLSIVIIIYFIFASMSIDCVGHVQTSEAFSYATKSVSICIATGIEHLVHMIFIIIFKFEYNVLTFVLIGVGLIVMGLSTLLTVPAKTKGMSLRQTRDIYRNKQHIFPTETV